MDVFFELENAHSSEDQSVALSSFNSILTSASNLASSSFVTSTNFSLKIWVLRPVDFSENFFKKVLEAQEGSRFQEVEHIRLATSGYFENKNASLNFGEQSNLVFCDSDVIYDPDYLEKMALGFSAHPNAVLYGRTFALSGSSPNEEKSALSWLFPPRSIGYGSSWPRSRWANNMGIPREILSKIPMPVVSLPCFRNVETKQERYLWERRTSALGVRHVEIEAAGEHVQFKSISSWIARQWAHGLGTSFRLREEQIALWRALPRLAKPLSKRAADLSVLRKSVKASGSFGGALVWLELARIVRLIACIVSYSCISGWSVKWEPDGISVN